MLLLCWPAGHTAAGADLLPELIFVADAALGALLDLVAGRSSASTSSAALIAAQTSLWLKQRLGSGEPRAQARAPCRASCRASYAVLTYS
jgi:hypothetical protein